MSWLRWHPDRWIRRRSRAGFIGLILLAACLSLDLALLGPAHERVEQLQKKIALANAARNPSAKPQAREALAAQQLAHYYSNFPPQSSAPDWLKKIYQAADEQKIPLEQGEYQVQRAENGKIVSYHIAMPVKGTYAQLRHFIAEVLTNIPIASLDHVSFERQKIEDPVIDAKITFTLYLVTP